MSKESSYTKHGSAKHYDSRIAVIHMMERIWGTEAVLLFCEMSAFKYTQRIGLKEGVDKEEELTKIQWYRRASAYYKKKLNDKDVVFKPCEPYEGLPLPVFISKEK